MSKVGTRLVRLEVGGTDRYDEVSGARITSAESDSDFLTFKQASEGGARDYALRFVAAQDHVTGTLWDLVWTGAGTEVAGTYMPYGNTTPSVSEPHYDFTAVVSEPDGDFMGGDADTSTTAVMTIECEWKLTGKPTKVTV
jgi:hypothetical protein